MKESSKKSLAQILLIGAKLFIICTVVAALVSFAFSLTAQKYEENIAMEKKKAIIGIFGSETLTYTDLQESLGADFPVYQVVDGTQILGYCMQTTSNGFGGEMQLMVGFKADGSILGVKVISNAETPGVGSNALTAEHLGLYEGKRGELKLGSDVSAVSGATVSSTAVHEGVSKAIALMQRIDVPGGGN